MGNASKLQRLTRQVRTAIRDPGKILPWVRSAMAASRDVANDRLDFNATYRAYVEKMKARNVDASAALETAIGGQFEAFGKVQRDLLVSVGLRPDQYVVDVGCGAGRLARPLATYLTTGRYLGIDVVPELVEHAAALAQRPDWRFDVARGLKIPEQDGQADFVCFFSVLTHLLHEESFVYLRDAKRVLRPGGKIVFSFLEFHIYSHWAVFDSNVRNVGGRQPLNQFMSRDAIDAWAHHLDLDVQGIFDGDKPHIPLREAVVLDDGTRMEGLGNLGQSVCVLARRA